MTPPEAEREAFETWAKEQWGSLSSAPQNAWLGFQAGRASIPLSPPGVVQAEPAAWVTPLRYGSQVTVYKPPKPDRWDDDDGVGEWYCRPLYAATPSPPPVPAEPPELWTQHARGTENEWYSHGQWSVRKSQGLWVLRRGTEVVASDEYLQTAMSKATLPAEPTADALDAKRVREAAPDLLAALRELHATVKGECSSLLDGDRGGSDRLGMMVEAALTKAGAPS